VTIPKMSYTAEARMQRNRANKARRFVSHFFDKMREAGVKNPEADKDALEKALAIVRNATVEQWEQLASAITEENRERARKNGHRSWKKEEPPSGATFTLIVEQLETAIKNVGLHVCRDCGGVPDPTDPGRLCLECQAKELFEGNNEERIAHGESPRWA
jgi:hypothetical protein